MLFSIQEKVQKLTDGKNIEIRAWVSYGRYNRKEKLKDSDRGRILGKNSSAIAAMR